MVLDEGRFPESELPGPENLAGLVVRAEQSAGTDAAHRVLRSLLLHLADPEFAELKRAFLSWSGAFLKIDPNDIDQARLEAAIIEEDPNMLRTILEQEQQQIRQSAKQEGRQEGRLETALAMLSPVLELRFGPLPPAARERIASATVDDIDRWTVRLFTAPSLEAVLDD